MLLRCLFVLAFAAPLNAQTEYRCDRSEGSVIIGSVLDAHARNPVVGTHISLYRDPDLYCQTTSDAGGRFVFKGVPAGSFILMAGKRFDVTTAGSDTVRVTAEVVTGGPLEVCQKTPSCAPWVRPMRVRGLSEPEQFEFDLLRLAAVLASANPTQSTEWFCVPKSSQLVMKAMQRLYSRSVPSSECDLEGDDDPGRTDAHLVHKPTRQKAVQLNTGQLYAGHDPSTDHASPPLREGGSPPRTEEREVKLGYYVGPLYAEGFTCLLRKTVDGWIPVTCRSDWIS